MDHRGLKYLFILLTLNVKQTRWFKFLSEYDFETKQLKEKKIKWLIHSTKESVRCILQPLSCRYMYYRNILLTPCNLLIRPFPFPYVDLKSLFAIPRAKIYIFLHIHSIIAIHHAYTQVAPLQPLYIGFCA
jgi:hypothetical protein